MYIYKYAIDMYVFTLVYFKSSLLFNFSKKIRKKKYFLKKMIPSTNILSSLSGHLISY